MADAILATSCLATVWHSMSVVNRGISICRGRGVAPLAFHWWRAGGLLRVYGRNSMAMGVKRHCIVSGGHFWQGAPYRLGVVIAYRLRWYVRVIVNRVKIFGIGVSPRACPFIGA